MKITCRILWLRGIPVCCWLAGLFLGSLTVWADSSNQKEFYLDWLAVVFADERAAMVFVDDFEKQFAESGSALDQALWGGALLARAHHEPSLFRKRGLYRNGVHHLNEAMGAEPENARIRLTRATGFSLLPVAAGLAETTHQDFQKLLEDAEAVGEMEMRLRFEIFMRAGAWFVREGNERALPVLKKAEELASRVNGGEERLKPLLDAAKTVGN